MRAPSSERSQNNIATDGHDLGEERKLNNYKRMHYKVLQLNSFIHGEFYQLSDWYVSMACKQTA